MRTFLAIILVAALGLFLAFPAPAAPPADPNELTLEVAALQTLRKLDLIQDQLKALAELTKSITPRAKTRTPAKVSDKYKKALNNLHAALVRGDEDKIHESQEKLDEIALTDSAELDDEVDATDEARKRAVDALELLNARQLGNLATTITIADPVERLIEGLDEVRGQDSADKVQACDDVATAVSRLLAGHGTDQARQVKEQVMEFLTKAQEMPDATYKKEKPNLEKAARQLLPKYKAVDVLCHNVENGLAELLANPRLGQAIALIQKK